MNRKFGMINKTKSPNDSVDQLGLRNADSLENMDSQAHFKI